MKRKNGCTGLLALLVASSLLTVALSEEGYGCFLSLETPTPEGNEWFGYNVNICGDVVLSSEPYGDLDEEIDAGKVYLYDIEGSLVSILVSPNPDSDNKFGISSDIYEDKIIVGESADIGELEWAGLAHIFDSEGNLLKTLQAPNPEAGEHYGASGVAIGRDRILVSEHGKDLEVGLSGRVHMYDLQGNYMKTLTSPSPKVRGYFGSSLKVGDDIILIGEIGHYGSDKVIGGSVYVYDLDGNHLMTLQAPEPEEHACYGVSISTSEDKIVVGECYATVNDAWRAGRAYLYNENGELLHTYVAPVPEQNARFGYDVAISGETVVIGEWNADVEAAMNEGKTYVFDTDGNLLATITAPEPCPRAAFGFAVDVEGDTIVVGECWATVNGNSNSGKIHFYGKGAEPATPESEESPIETVAEETTEDRAEGIPGFPVEALSLGVICIVVFYGLMQRKRSSPFF